MESYIFKAFVKGIFKTSGALLVLGVGMFIYENSNKLWEKHCGDEKQKSECLNEFIIENRFSMGIDHTTGDITVLKTDEDETGQLYVRGHVFKSFGKLKQETETQEKETQQIVDKDFKQLFTF